MNCPIRFIRIFQCTKCHTEVTDHLKRPCSTNEPVDCSSCHAEVFDNYFASGHGQAHYNKVENAPYCTDCHGTHETKSRYDDTSPVYRTAIPGLCGECHRENGKAPNVHRTKGGQCICRLFIKCTWPGTYR